MPTATPPSRDAALETRVFWERFKTEIIAVLIIVLLAIAGFAGYRFYSDHRAAAASALLASAKSAQAYQQVIANYPNTPAGADAYLLLAEAQRNERKFTEATGTLQVFINKNPNHELVSTAKMAMAANLVLADDLKVGDLVVVKAGAKAVGTISHSKKAGMMGKAGELNMRLQYLLVGDARMRLRGSKGKEGEGKEGQMVALTVLFGPIGLIKHGKNVEIKEGTPLKAYVDENFEVPASK